MSVDSKGQPLNTSSGWKKKTKKAIDILLSKFDVLTWRSWTSKTLFTLLLNICKTLETDYCEQLCSGLVTFYHDYQESVSQLAFLSFTLHARVRLYSTFGIGEPLMIWKPDPAKEKKKQKYIPCFGQNPRIYYLNCLGQRKCILFKTETWTKLYTLFRTESPKITYPRLGQRGK